MKSVNVRAVARAAERFMACGQPVFLLGRGKRPVANCQACRTAGPGHDLAGCGHLTCHGFHAATLDPGRFAKMQEAVPGGLLAVRTGRASGLVVVDIDPAHGGRVDVALMPPTAHVVTGSGGLHLYYRHPGAAVGCSQGVVGQGIDIRGEGGYVVAPPSIHPGTGRAYRWGPPRPLTEMPPPLRAACQPRPPLAATAPAGPTPTTPGRGISSPAALLAAHLRAIDTAPVGRRRGALYGASRGVARMVAAGALAHADATAALTAAGQRAEQTPREIRAAIVGGFRDEGVTA